MRHSARQQTYRFHLPGVQQLLLAPMFGHIHNSGECAGKRPPHCARVPSNL